jgi:hypothetical protein
MKHLSIELLELYALRELSGREHQRVETHVTRCPECLDRLQGGGWMGEWNALDEPDEKKVSKSSRKQPGSEK